MPERFSLEPRFSRGRMHQPHQLRAVASESSLLSGESPISTISQESEGGASLINAFATIRVKEPLHKLPTSTATLNCFSIFTFGDWKRSRHKGRLEHRRSCRVQEAPRTKAIAHARKARAVSRGRRRAWRIMRFGERPAIKPERVPRGAVSTRRDARKQRAASEGRNRPSGRCEYIIIDYGRRAGRGLY